MKFRIWEKILNEVVGTPDKVLLGEVEAENFIEAHKIARYQYPGKSTLRIDDQNKIAVDYDSEEM